MAQKKYMSLERLTGYDELIKAEIAEGDASVKSYVDTEVAKKANTSHTHDDRYYTESEIDSKISTINTSISNIASGTTTVKKAEEATTATSANDADKLGGQLPSYYAKASDIPTGALADKDTVSESDLDSALAEKVNAAAEGNHSHSNKTVLDGITSTKVSAWDSAEANAKAYADTAATNVKNDLLNGAGTAYDTLKELGDLIDDNKDAIDALEEIASGKANATHSHAIADVSGLQTALDGKATASHGTHVTFDSTNKPKMDGTAAFGTSTKVARADHVHPTDTSRASQTDLDTHVADTTKHITSTERTNWGTAYTHSQSAHAPSNAEKNQNAFSNVKVGTTTVAADSATDTFEIAAGTGISVAGDATNDKVTITNSGVIAVSTGTANGTISVNTNGTAANVAVKGLGSAAYTNSSAYATAGHTHTVDSALSSSSTNPVQNKVVNSAISTLTSTVSTNTSSISANTSSIASIQAELDDIVEITSSEISALFAK